MAVSLAPKTFVETGLLDDADVEITDVAFCKWNYQGKSPEVLALGIEFTEIHPGPDGQHKKHEQYYSAGDLAFFRPSPDGATMEPVSDKTAMNSNTNAAQFLSSVVKAGFPESQFEAGSCKVLKGLRVHVNRVAQPKRPGLVKQEGEKEKTVLLVSRILSQQMPAAGAPSGKLGGLGSGTAFPPQPTQSTVAPVAMPQAPSPAAPAASPLSAAAAPAGSNEVRDLAQSTLINLLVANGGVIEKKNIPGAAFRALAGNPLQSQVVPILFDDTFLMQCGGVTYDGATVKLA